MRIKIIFLALIVFGLGFTIKGYSQDLPLIVNANQPTLYERINLGFQKKLELQLGKNKKLKSLISQKKMTVGLVDLSNLDNIKFAQINGDEMMYAASLPKISVLLAAMDAIENGQLEETTEVKKDLRLMIAKSNNKATTRMIDLVGFDKIEEVLTSNNYRLYDEDSSGGLWVGKRYAAGGDTNREPLKNLSHAATATQVCRFYYLLLQGKLVNRARSVQMLSIMENPELHHKFVNTLNKVAPNASLFRKSGSWKSYHSDSVLVWGEKRKYILVALVQDANGETILRNLVNSVDKVLLM